MPGATKPKADDDAGPADGGQQYTVIVALRGAASGKEFLMVDHKRRGWELPGGKVEAGEGPVHCALREFREETGHLLASPRFVAKLRKPNGTCYVFTGGLGAKVDDVDAGDAVGGMKWFARLPRGERLAFPDDPYEEMGQMLGIDFG
jgi:8-oxo-dGTP diphosphatase